jgi:inner membrane protein involved in colicin E2 resistance
MESVWNVWLAAIYSIVFIVFWAWALVLYTLIEMVTDDNPLMAQVLWAIQLTLIGVSLVVYYLLYAG